LHLKYKKGGNYMNKLRILSMLAIMVMIISLIAGCGGDGKTSETEGGSITIKVDVQPFASPQTLPRIGELIKEFETENNIKVDLTVSVNDDPYRVKLLQDIAANNAADVAFIDGGWLPEFDAIDALVPLDKWFTADKQSKFLDLAYRNSRILLSQRFTSGSRI